MNTETAQTTWKPRNKAKTDEKTPFVYFGTCPTADAILIYGEKEEGKKEPQSRRTLSVQTIAKMIRGEVGIGTPGVDALQPIGGDRDVFDVRSMLDDGCSHRNAYIEACNIVLKEVGEDKAPEWLLDDASAEVE